VDAAATALEIAGVTDAGRRRARNEDAIYWDAELGVALVADGMGGRSGGEVASTTAVRSIKSDLRLALAGPHGRAGGCGAAGECAAMLSELVRRANQRVLLAAARDPRCRGMGTTLVMALFSQGHLSVANVGDSRAYRLRDARLELLTHDHSMVQELVDRGAMNATEATLSQHRSVLTRALGVGPDIEVDVEHHHTLPGDVLMLCSDGLTRMATDAEIAGVIAPHLGDLRRAARAAVDFANARGGFDNVSIVLMRAGEACHG